MITVYTAEDRFWSKVNKDGPIPRNDPKLGACWIWMAAKNGHGYGVFCEGHQHLVAAHRYSYFLAGNIIPPNLELDHLCRNHSCVNPRHIQLVSRHENIIRGIGPSLSRLRQLLKTACPRGHPYDLINTYFSKKGRACRVCRHEVSRKQNLRRRLICQ